MIEKQIVYLPVNIEKELPHEFNIVTFIAKVPVTNQYEKLTSETEIDFSFKGWLEDGKFLMHGLGEELAEGKVTHWLKPQEAFVFTPEQLNEYITNVIKKALENAIEKSELKQKNYFEATFEERLKGIDIYDDNGSDKPSFVAFLDKKSITNTFEETYNKLKV